MLSVRYLKNSIFPSPMHLYQITSLQKWEKVEVGLYGKFRYSLWLNFFHFFSKASVEDYNSEVGEIVHEMNTIDIGDKNLIAAALDVAAAMLLKGKPNGLTLVEIVKIFEPFLTKMLWTISTKNEILACIIQYWGHIIKLVQDTFQISGVISCQLVFVNVK